MKPTDIRKVELSITELEHFMRQLMTNYIHGFSHNSIDMKHLVCRLSELAKELD